MKKLIAMLLALAMVCSLLPGVALAEETAGALVTLEYPEDLCTVTVTDRNNSSATVENGGYLMLNSNGKASAIFEIENIAEGYRIAEVILNGEDYTVNFITGAYGGMARSGISEDVTLGVALEEIPDLPVLESFEVYTDDTYTQTLDTDLTLTEAVQIYIKGIYADGGAYPDYTARGHMEYTLDGTTWKWTQWGGDYWYFPLNDTFYTDFNPLADSFDFRICIEPDGLYCTGDAVYSDVYHVNGGAGGSGSADDNETERDDTISGTCGDNLTWTQDGDGVLTISGTGPMWDFDDMVPGWNLYGGNMTHVVIESGVTSIGAKAFEMCGLTSIDIPDTVTSIGEYAFHLSCLESAVIPESVTQFGKAIFCESGLGDVTLPANMTEIPDDMFHGCSAMTSVEIPASVTSVGDYAFFNTTMDRVTVPAGVVSVGNMAFGNYWAFDYAEVTFLGDAPAIEDGAFAYQNVTVYYPEGNDTWNDVISSYVPDEGDSITWTAKSDSAAETISGTCGDNLTWTLDAAGTLTISGTGALSYEHQEWEPYKDGIKALVIEEGVTGEVGYFESYENLTSVSLPSTVTEMNMAAFSRCTALETVTLSEGLKSIGSNAFYGCTSLTEIVIPASVTKIGARPFAYCSNLSGLWVDENSETYINDENGVLFTKDMTTLVEAPCTLKGDYVIPETVSVINWAAFSGCTGLTSAVIPDGVLCIDSSLFADCTALTSVEIPDSVEWLGNWAFQNCSSLKEITIPASVTSIYPGIFDGCTALEKVVFEGDAPGIGDYYTFDGLTTTAYYPAGNSTWTEDMMRNFGGNITWVPYETGISGTCGDNLTWTLADGVLTISGTGDMYSYQSEDNRDQLPPWVEGGYDVKTVVIEDGVTSIGAKAFRNCATVTTVSMADSVTMIQSGAFDGCTALQSIELSGGLERIGDCAFYNCSALETIEIPDGVQCLDAETFYGCSTLKNVTIGTGMVEIMADAFDGCEALESITFTGDAPEFIGDVSVEAIGYYPADNETWTEDMMATAGENITWIPYGDEVAEEPGDMDGNGTVDENDVAKLLWYTLFPESYEIAGNADFNGDGSIDEADVAYLLWHTLFPDAYPLV